MSCANIFIVNNKTLRLGFIPRYYGCWFVLSFPFALFSTYLTPFLSSILWYAWVILKLLHKVEILFGSTYKTTFCKQTDRQTETHAHLPPPSPSVSNGVQFKILDRNQVISLPWGGSLNKSCQSECLKDLFIASWCSKNLFTEWAI